MVGVPFPNISLNLGDLHFLLPLILIEARCSSITETGQCYPLMGGRRGSLGPGWTHYLMAPGWPQLTSQLCQLQQVLTAFNLTLCPPCTHLSFIPRFGPPLGLEARPLLQQPPVSVLEEFNEAEQTDSWSHGGISSHFGGQKLGIPFNLIVWGF